MRNENKKHKQCIQEVINKTKTTHNCLREAPINRNGDWHFIDIIGHPHKEKETLWKPFATECENESHKLQKESNKLDLLAWKKHYPEGEIFQINNADELSLNKLKKTQFKFSRRS